MFFYHVQMVCDAPLLLSLRDDWVLVGLCYPSDTTFQIMSDTYDRQSNTFDDIKDYGTVSSFLELQKRPMERKYFFDQSAGWDERRMIFCFKIFILTLLHALNSWKYCYVITAGYSLAFNTSWRQLYFKYFYPFTPLCVNWASETLLCSSSAAYCGSTFGPGMVVMVTATVQLKAVKEWKWQPPHPPKRPVTVQPKPTPRTPRLPQQWCLCRLWTQSPAGTAVLNRFLNIKVDRFICALKSEAATTDQRASLCQLVFSSEPWTSYLQTQIRSLSVKEQQQGENSSFITVSMKANPNTSLRLYDLNFRTWIGVYLIQFLCCNSSRWMRWPCPSHSQAFSWSQWTPALEKSPRKPPLARWMARWKHT